MSRQLTSGEWPVTKLSGVDEARGLVYFECWTDLPLERHLYRVPLSGDTLPGGPGEQITRRPGWHQVALAAD